MAAGGSQKLSGRCRNESDLVNSKRARAALGLEWKLSEPLGREIDVMDVCDCL